MTSSMRFQNLTYLRSIFLFNVFVYLVVPASCLAILEKVNVICKDPQVSSNICMISSSNNIKNGLMSLYEIVPKNYIQNYCGYSEKFDDNLEFQTFNYEKFVCEVLVPVDWTEMQLRWGSSVENLRPRRQAGSHYKGRFRGQTQSQYLAVDGGKEEGRAEAESNADTSRAIVSGTSGMGQAQSQSVYDPSCDECRDGTDDVGNLKRPSSETGDWTRPNEGSDRSHGVPERSGSEGVHKPSQNTDSVQGPSINGGGPNYQGNPYSTSGSGGPNAGNLPSFNNRWNTQGTGPSLVGVQPGLTSNNEWNTPSQGTGPISGKQVPQNIPSGNNGWNTPSPGTGTNNGNQGQHNIPSGNNGWTPSQGTAQNIPSGNNGWNTPSPGTGTNNGNQGQHNIPSGNNGWTPSQGTGPISGKQGPQNIPSGNNGWNTPTWSGPSNGHQGPHNIPSGNNGWSTQSQRNGPNNGNQGSQNIPSGNNGWNNPAQGAGANRGDQGPQNIPSGNNAWITPSQGAVPNIEDQGTQNNPSGNNGWKNPSQATGPVSGPQVSQNIPNGNNGWNIPSQGTGPNSGKQGPENVPSGSNGWITPNHAISRQPGQSDKSPGPGNYDSWPSPNNGFGHSWPFFTPLPGSTYFCCVVSPENNTQMFGIGPGGYGPGQHHGSTGGKDPSHGDGNTGISFPAQAGPGQGSAGYGPTQGGAGYGPIQGGAGYAPSQGGIGYVPSQGETGTGGNGQGQAGGGPGGYGPNQGRGTDGFEPGQGDGGGTAGYVPSQGIGNTDVSAPVQGPRPTQDNVGPRRDAGGYGPQHVGGTAIFGPGSGPDPAAGQRQPWQTQGVGPGSYGLILGSGTPGFVPSQVVGSGSYGPGQGSTGINGYGPNQVTGNIGGNYRPNQGSAQFGPVHAQEGYGLTPNTANGGFGPNQEVGTGVYRPSQVGGNNGGYVPGPEVGNIGGYRPSQGTLHSWPGQAQGGGGNISGQGVDAGGYRPGQVGAGSYAPDQVTGQGMPGQHQGGGTGSYGPNQIGGGTNGYEPSPGIGIGGYLPTQGIGSGGYVPTQGGLNKDDYGPVQGSGNIGGYGPGQGSGGGGYVPGQIDSTSGYGPGQSGGTGQYGPALPSSVGGQWPTQGLSGGYGPGQGVGTGVHSPGVGIGASGYVPGHGSGGQVPVQEVETSGYSPVGGGNHGVPENVLDPNSVTGSGNDESEALASVTQDGNGTLASASSKGGTDKSKAQTQVQGTYNGSGSFSAQAQIDDDNKNAESVVEGSKKGASSKAQGRGRNNKSQAGVQLGSETGSLETNAQSEGTQHSSSSQVQGSVKGGMADAQARGPGSTSSQAQIGFTPYTEGDKSHDKLNATFVGGGTASAKSSGRTGQSQSQLQGMFKYGIKYNGAAQSGASLDKDAVFSNRLPFNKIDVYDGSNKNIDVDYNKDEETPLPLPFDLNSTDASSKEEIKQSGNSKFNVNHKHSDHHQNQTEKSKVHGSDIVKSTSSRRSFPTTHSLNNADYEYTTDKDDFSPDDYDPDSVFNPELVEGDQYPNYDDLSKDSVTHQSVHSSRAKGLEVKQTTGGNTQHIILPTLSGRDAKITQKNTDQALDVTKVYQPEEKVPGTDGYMIPIGFTGRVKSVSSKDKTYVLGSNESPSQAQTVTLSKGTGKLNYLYPKTHTKTVNPTDLRSLNYKPEKNRYLTVTKSVTGALDANNNIKKEFTHTYYTKSSSCGYFTFTCTIVSGSDGRKKVCRPKMPTNPDGTPMNC